MLKRDAILKKDSVVGDVALSSNEDNDRPQESSAKPVRRRNEGM